MWIHPNRSVHPRRVHGSLLPRIPPSRHQRVAMESFLLPVTDRTWGAIHRDGHHTESQEGSRVSVVSTSCFLYNTTSCFLLLTGLGALFIETVSTLKVRRGAEYLW